MINKPQPMLKWLISENVKLSYKLRVIISLIALPFFVDAVLELTTTEALIASLIGLGYYFFTYKYIRDEYNRYVEYINSDTDILN